MGDVSCCPVPSPGLCSHWWECSGGGIWDDAVLCFSACSLLCLCHTQVSQCSCFPPLQPCAPSPAPPDWALSRLALEPRGIGKHQTTKPLWGECIFDLWCLCWSLWILGHFPQCGAWQQCRVARKCHRKCLDKEHTFLGVLVHSASPGDTSASWRLSANCISGWSEQKLHLCAGKGNVSINRDALWQLQWAEITDWWSVLHRLMMAGKWD